MPARQSGSSVAFREKHQPALEIYVPIRLKNKQARTDLAHSDSTNACSVSLLMVGIYN